MAAYLFLLQATNSIPDVVLEVVKQVPALAVLCWMAQTFLRAQKTFLEQNNQISQSSIGSLAKSAEALAQVQVTLARMEKNQDQVLELVLQLLGDRRNVGGHR